MPVIGIDSSADSDAFSSFLTTDNVQGGRIAADGLVAAIKAATGKEEGEVALITSVPNAGSLEERKQGFIEQLAKYPGIKLVADKYADGQAATGLNITTDLLTANPNLVGIFASNLIMAQGAGQALAENGAAERVSLIGFDSDDKLVSFLKDGTIDGLVVQDPYRMGYDGIKTALAVSKGESVEKFVDTGANLITTANMEEARSQELLNPKVTDPSARRPPGAAPRRSGTQRSACRAARLSLGESEACVSQPLPQPRPAARPLRAPARRRTSSSNCATSKSATATSRP